jgi:hypothetical protein
MCMRVYACMRVYECVYMYVCICVYVWGGRWEISGYLHNLSHSQIIRALPIILKVSGLFTLAELYTSHLEITTPYVLQPILLLILEQFIKESCSP